MDKARMTIRFDRSGQPLADRPKGTQMSEPQRMSAPSSEIEIEDLRRLEDLPFDQTPIHRFVEAAGTRERLVPWKQPQNSGDADPSNSDPPDDLRDIRRMDSGPLNQFTSDFGAWSSPFDAEVQRLEALIRNSSPPQEADSNRRSEPEPPMHGSGTVPIDVERPFMGETGYYASYVPVVSSRPITRVRRPPGSGLFKLIATVSAAVITGLLFGWLALSLFTEGTVPGLPNLSEPASKSSTGEGAYDAPPSTSPQNSETAAGTGGANGGKEPAAAENGLLEVNLPARTYFVLQNGIFSTPEGAQSAQAALENLGFASASEQRERIHVYAGLAATRADANALKLKLEQSDAEVFVKEYSIPAVRHIQWEGEASDGAAGYFHSADELVGLIARLTAVRIDSGEPMPFDDQTIGKIAEHHRAWSASAAAAASGLQAEDLETLKRMDNAVNTAVMLMAEYNRNPSVSYLWQAQAAITQYVLLENGLLTKLAAP
jgi:stage II sporulation protein B